MAAEILEIIRKEMDIEAHIKNWEQLTPFETLVQTILSQNTTDRTSFQAFKNLRKKFGKIEPERIVKASQEEIQEEIRLAGLHRQKSKRIIEVAQIILNEWDSDFSFIYEAPLDIARNRLIRLPGIGKKTADILLNFIAHRPILPVDTHITRISKRIGLVRPNAKYDEIREAIEIIIPEEQIFTIHISLIHFGRQVCKALKPQCPTCPVTQLCPKLIEVRGKLKKSRKKPR
ncbi:MAG: endonuclease III domain-containing protein [Candidatus Helarchaeota archaeon]